MGPSPPLWLLHAKQRLFDQNYKSLWVPALIYGFCMQNCDFWLRNTSLYGSQTSSVDLWMRNSAYSTRIINTQESKTSPVVLCMQNNVISIRNTSLYGSLPSYAVFAFKTATLGPELQVSMVPRPHLRCFVLKAATLAPKLKVSMGASPHLWFLHAKRRLLDQKYKSLWVPDFAKGFSHSRQRL